jgi:hypothetical protein
MSKYFKIAGYFKDDKSEFDDYIVKEYDDAEEDEDRDLQIFYYGLSENEIIQAIADGEDNGILDFVITSYEETELGGTFNYAN